MDFHCYRKRPVVVEAAQITEPMEVDTLEGTMRGNVGDWLIIGVEGERYFCKDTVFQRTYEAVEREVGATQMPPEPPPMQRIRRGH